MDVPLAWPAQHRLPSREAVQNQVAAQVGRAENTPVTARCTRPDRDGYTCRLRDSAGRYGYAITAYHRTR